MYAAQQSGFYTALWVFYVGTCFRRNGFLEFASSARIRWSVPLAVACTLNHTHPRALAATTQDTKWQLLQIGLLREYLEMDMKPAGEGV